MESEREEREEGSRRQPGQRPDAREREELLSWVERALMGGAARPADVLDAVPDLGTWDTARSYIDEVRGQWRRESAREELRERRAELVALVRASIQRAFVALGRTDNPIAADRLLRSIDRLVQREVFLLALDPEDLAWEEKKREEEEATRRVEEEEERRREERREARRRAKANPSPDPSPQAERGETSNGLAPLSACGEGPGVRSGPTPDFPNPTRIDPAEGLMK